MTFWERVDACSHNQLSDDYCEPTGCPMAEVGCWNHEVHCLDCGAYIASCGAGCCNGISGWSAKRWRAHFNRQRTA